MNVDIKNKKRDIVLIVLFCGVIGILGLLYFIVPDKDFSINEKRYLEELPIVSFETITSGEFSENFDLYLSDHFACRDFFVGLNAYYDLLSGRNGANGVYKGKDDYLIEEPVQFDKENLDKNIAAIQAFSQSTGIKPELLVVPSTGFIENDKLPAIHRTYQDDTILSYAIEQLGDSVEYIDLTSVFAETKDNLQIYYKTDHHWTSAGAYEAYKVYCKTVGIPYTPIDQYDIDTVNGLYGTTYSRSALWMNGSDVLEIYRNIHADYTVSIFEQDIENNSLFFTEHLDKSDKYNVFLDGNHSLIKITNNRRSDGESLLIIKDSYAHCFTPFVAEDYAEVYMVDLRYYKSSLSELIKQYSIDNVLILYGIDNFVNDTNLVWLR